MKRIIELSCIFLLIIVIFVIVQPKMTVPENYENKLVKQSIQNLSKKMGLSENVIKAIIQHELEEMMIKRQK